MSALLNAAGEDDLALANALLALEAEHRAEQFAALEALQAHAQFSDGELDDRVSGLPHRAFGRAASACTRSDGSRAQLGRSDIDAASSSCPSSFSN